METKHPHEAFKYCPRCGADALNGDRADLLICAACDLHYHLNPAGAVAVIIRDAQNRILMMARNHDPCKGLLDLPGGFIDFGENAEAAAMREVYEETGLQVDNLAYLGTNINRGYAYRGLYYQTVDLFFTCRLKDGQQPQPGVEAAAVHFLEASAIEPDQIAFQSIREGLERWGKRH